MSANIDNLVWMSPGLPVEDEDVSTGGYWPAFSVGRVTPECMFKGTAGQTPSQRKIQNII